MPTASSQPRSPSSRALATRQRILDAAHAEFAEKGLAGARVDEIANRAVVNKRMLYAYYGTKEDLWIAVLDRAYSKKRDEENLLNVDSLPPEEAMSRLVSFNLRYTAAHPDFVALLNQENLNQAVYIARSEKVQSLYTPLLGMINSVLARGVVAGVFRANVDPMQLYITIVGIGHFYVANRHTLSSIFGASLMSQAVLGEREAHCIAVVLGYLRP